MNDYKTQAAEIIKTLTLEEKCSLLSGKDFWRTREIPGKVQSVMMADGPHGLRKEPLGKYDGITVAGSLPAVCFPTAATMACTFNPELVEKVGEAIAEEARAEKVCLLLGPGINIKRDPLCGRNFEYYSEDPYLSGIMGASFIEGVQSKGVGATVKHFALNNQENYRMTVNAVCDERAKREIYYKAFEMAIKSKPMAVMSSYNRVDGFYTSENKELMDDLLCKEWGFEGMTVSDWAAVNDRVLSLKCNLHLEMPGGVADNNNRVLAAVKNGEITEEFLDEKLNNVVAMILFGADAVKDDYSYDIDKHREIARDVAAEGAVLLKNDGMLPLKNQEKYLVIGDLFENIRYQGSGSSLINPERLITHRTAFDEAGIKYEYVKGYHRRSAKAAKALVKEALNAAARYENIIIYAGLPALFESEGYDRRHMKIPKNQVELITAVAKVNPNITVVLTGGSVMELSFEKNVRAILCAYLCGQEGAYAITDILLGKINPSGKLAETWGNKYEDYPSAHTDNGPVVAEYRDSIFVGYRYFATAEVPVKYPFGYGLSYTGYEYSGIEVLKKNTSGKDILTVSFAVKNSGAIDGKETAQVYVSKPDSAVMRPLIEFKGFKKVFLKAGESKPVSIDIDYDFLKIYDTAQKKWILEDGEYNIYVGGSSVELPLSVTVVIDGEKLQGGVLDSYKQLYPFSVSDSDFAKLYGKTLPEKTRLKKPYHYNTEIGDINKSLIGRVISRKAMPNYTKKQLAADENLEILVSMFKYGLIYNPLRAIVLSSGGILDFETLDAILMYLNGHKLKAVKKILRAFKRLKNIK